jgi:CheY-like chemotaxis protein
LPRNETGALKGFNVLVVDDDPDSQEILCALLEQHGAHVTCAASAAEALQHVVAGGRYRVLVSDLMLPVLDGFWLVRQVKMIANQAGWAVWAILVTGSQIRELETSAREAGFDVCIRKPASFDALLRAIADLERGPVRGDG